MLHLQKVNQFYRDQVVMVKLTGDGTSVSCSVYLLVVAFVIIQDSVVALITVQ